MFKMEQSDKLQNDYMENRFIISYLVDESILCAILLSIFPSSPQPQSEIYLA